MLEGHPLAARFLGSHPLSTKAPGRPELGEGEVKRGEGPIHKKLRAPPSLEVFTPPTSTPWQQLEPTIIPSSAI